MAADPRIRVRKLTDLTPSQRLEAIVCPYCKDRIDEIATCYECAACATWFHDACFLENKGCMTLGCKEARSNKPPERRRVVVAAAPGLNKTEVLVAFGQACGTGAAVLVFGAANASTASEARAALGAGLVISVVAFALMLRVAASRPPRLKLSSGQQWLLALCALAAAVGVVVLLALIGRATRGY